MRCASARTRPSTLWPTLKPPTLSTFKIGPRDGMKGGLVSYFQLSRFELAAPQPLFTFNHPNWEKIIDNTRYIKKTFSPLNTQHLLDQVCGAELHSCCRLCPARVRRLLRVQAVQGDHDQHPPRHPLPRHVLLVPDSLPTPRARPAENGR